MLDLRRLQALQAVAASGTVKDAAARLGYTPSAVSQHIAALERETHSVLLEPSGRGIRLTAAGRLLAERAAGILDRVAEAETALTALNAGESGVLRLASFATAGGQLLPPALARVRAAHARLDISVRVAEREDAISLLRRGELDLAVIEAHTDTVTADGDHLIAHPLLTDPFRIAVPRSHPLARKRIIALGDAAAEPWVDIACEKGCCRTETNAAFDRAGFTPRRTIEADDYWPAQGFVAAGLGLALIPELALGVRHDGVAVRRLQSASQPERRIFAVTGAAVSATAPVRAMIIALKDQADQHSTGAIRPGKAEVP